MVHGKPEIVFTWVDRLAINILTQKGKSDHQIAKVLNVGVYAIERYRFKEKYKFN